MLKIAVVTVQSEYLQKIMGQLDRIFGDRLDLHPIQLSNLSQARIDPDETVFSAIPNLKQRVKALFPHVKNYIVAKRSINVVNTGDLIQLRPGRRILVVGDIRPAAISITRELENQQLGHTYIPFSPEAEIPEDFEYVATAGDLPLLYDLKILP